MSESNEISVQRQWMEAVLKRQREAFQQDGFPDLTTRRDRLRRLVDMLLAHEDAIVAAQQTDFPGKSRALARLGELVGPIGAVHAIADKLDEWMRPDSVALPAELEAIGMRGEVHYQPLGVVGIISPWNGPIILSCLPLAGVLAAGNRAMVKMSELTPALATLFTEMVGRHFSEEEVAVFTGGPDVAAAFAQQPFDHLIYTGSARVAKLVMKAAAENLVPVTLELGGKSPVVVSRSAALDSAIPRLAYGKAMHGGQVCVTPDYLLVPREQIDSIAQGILDATGAMYPGLPSNNDYGPVINQERLARIMALVEDARQRGSRVLAAAPASADNLRFPLHIVLEPDDASLAMTDEIFGPVLPIKGYDSFEEALDYINRHARPLAAYYFGDDASELQSMQRRVTAGGLVVNDVVCQIFHEQLPFGGVGPSGMGRYRGREGFRTFSNPMTVLTQTDRDEIVGALRPPYGEVIDGFIAAQLKPL